MPALAKVVFAQVDSFGKKPIWDATKKAWVIYVNTDTTPGNRTITAEKMTILNTKLTVNIPVGYHGLIWSDAATAVDSGGTDVKPLPILLEGTGSAQTITIPYNYIDAVGAGNSVLTSGTQLGYFTVIKPEQFTAIRN